MSLEETALPDLWGHQPRDWDLGGDDAHVWRLLLDDETDDGGPLLQVLSPDERQRAASYRRVEDQDRFARTRGAARLLLARYCRLPPSEVRFVQTPAGKPELAGPAAASGVHFNVSHSGSIALLAFGRRRLGVDVESLRSGVACLAIARRYFSRREVAELESLPESQREAAFYRCWTRKEAYLKGTGLGISFGLASFSVSLLPQAPAAVVETPAADATPWLLFSLSPAEGYTAAMAVEGAASVTLNRCSWPPNDP